MYQCLSVAHLIKGAPDTVPAAAKALAESVRREPARFIINNAALRDDRPGAVIIEKREAKAGFPAMFPAALLRLPPGDRPNPAEPGVISAGEMIP
ncbi:MAG: hypothetical protein IKE57_06045 [Oscillospiraceae bacterium]|nr:hypothetical protein [Oscillospiraceae bacterium]